MVLLTRVLFTFCLIILTVQVFGQVSFDSTADLEKAANEFFDAGDFKSAKPLFSQLLSKDALEPNYNYRFGVCVLYTEADPLKPLPYIEGGANSSGVNKEAHYYLGKAYQYNYRFEDAITAYQKAKAAGYKAPSIDLERSIEECLNGKVLYNSAIEFKPAQNKEVIASEFYRPYDFRKLKGKVIPMPPNFKTKYDEKNLLGTVVYTPLNSNVLVYASYGEDGANGKDLYRVNRLPNGEWALPQRLPSMINTKYDEDYAFYDVATNTLFFASKGHNTMGGYDVFTSIFNDEDGSWSTPMNLQYPVNSPYDDFLYVNDPNGKVAFFTTARNTAEGKLRVFKTLLHDPKQVELSVVEGTYTDLTDSVYNYMSLTVLDPVSNQVVGKYRSHKETGKYLLILPPQNDYMMNVGPREAEGFKFEVDIPKHEPTKPLSQGVVYDASDDNGTVTLTNYFDATGKPDSIALAEIRPLNEVVDQMVAMPDPSEILAAKEEARLAEEKAMADAAAAKLAEEERIKAEKEVEEQRIRAEKAAEEARIAAEKEAADKARLAAEKARADSIAEVELARQIEAEALAAESEIAQAVEEKRQAQLEEQARLVAENEKLKAENEAMQDEAKMIEKQVDVALQLAETQEHVNQEDIDKALKKESEELAKQVEAKKLEEEMKLAEEKAKQDSARASELAAQMALEETRVKEQELAKKKEEEELRLAALEATRQDSIANAEAAQLAEAKKQQAVQDSILAAKQALAIAEKERLEVINREVEAAKEQALRDSAQVAVAEKNNVADNEGESFEDLLREMEEKEAELLREQEMAALNVDVASESQIEGGASSIVQKENPVDESPNVNASEIEEEAGLVESLGQKEVEALQSEPETASRAENLDTQVTTEGTEASSENTVDTKENEKESTVESTTTQTGVNGDLSESELFLQTIARIEEQKAEQERLIAEENAEKEKEKEERERRATELALAKASEVGGSDTFEHVVNQDEVAKLEAELEEIPDMEKEVVALKSDADPNEYLAVLDEIESQIKEEEKENNKNYTLQPLEGRERDGVKNEVVDPVLQQSIDKDRVVLAEHQRIAEEKERKLKEQMQRDRNTVDNYDESLAAEIESIENEVAELKTELDEVDSEKATAGLVRVPVEEQANVSNGNDKEELASLEEEIAAIEQIETEASEAVDDANEVSTSEELQPIVEETGESLESEDSDGLVEAEQEIAAIMDEAESKVEESSAKMNEAVSDEPVLVASKQTEEAATEELTIDEIDQSTVDMTTEAKEVIEEVAEETVDSSMENELAELMEEADSEWSEPELAAEPKTEESKTVAKPAAREVTVGTIPFLTAAIRNPDKSKPSFKGIKDRSIRRMIKRMRAEDVGRLAVMKNIKNESIDAAGNDQALKEIQDNLRNQDVLANATTNSREEYIRPAFDKNHLKRRQGVHYKLEFGIQTSDVSETVREAMTPEMEMTFAMPEFELIAEHYSTLADANSGYREYRSKGFDNVKVIPYLNGVPSTLSAVEEIPFVD